MIQLGVRGEKRMKYGIDYALDSLTTEQRNVRTSNIDEMTTLQVLQLINDEDKSVPYVVETQIPRIETLIEDIVAAFRKGGRLFYIGAGTSGRLGVLDASECPQG